MSFHDSDVLAQVLDDMPPDPTNIEDTLHVALLSGNLEEALKHAHKLDPWLSAHLADLMVPIELIDNEEDEEYGHSPSAYRKVALTFSSKVPASLFGITIPFRTQTICVRMRVYGGSR
jgi:nuclear pore complex protein Nup85